MDKRLLQFPDLFCCSVNDEHISLIAIRKGKVVAARQKGDSFAQLINLRLLNIRRVTVPRFGK